MPDFSRREMRREYGRVLSLFRSAALVVMAFTIVLCWVMYITKAGSMMLTVLVPLAMALLFVGASMVIYSDSWLICHTPYGQALTALGNAAALMTEIDSQARDADPGSVHALALETWLILFVDRGKNRAAAAPIPVSSIHHIEFVPDAQQKGWWMNVATEKQSYRTLLWDQEEMRSLADWSCTQERNLT